MAPWKFALRSLRHRPAFTAATVLILALGISSATALFSVIDTVLWKPLPYPDAGRLVSLYEANPAKQQNTSLIAPVRLEEWNRLNRSFEAISGAYAENLTDTSGGEPERLAGRRVAPRFFAVYGAKPEAGRTFTAEEEESGGPLAAVISHQLWRRRYNGDPGAIGKRLVLGGQGYTIVGVMRADFAPAAVDVWLPAQINAWLMQQRDARFYAGVGRMKPGVTPAQAQADLTNVQAALSRQFPKTDQGWSAQARDLKDARVGDRRASLSLMFAAVVLLLLIACANAGGLMLSQIHRRQRELAIRGSLGATRAQLIGVVLREAWLLALSAAALGFALAWWSVQLIRTTFLTLPRLDELRLDWRALLFTIGASLAATAVFGLAPALETLRTDVSGRLYQATRTHGRGRRLLQQGLVAAQFAVTLVLLVGAGLLVRSYAKLTQVDLGFDPGHVITFHIGAEWAENRPALGRLQERLVADFAHLPGVEAAGFVNFLPATGASLRFDVVLDGSPGETSAGKLQVGQRGIGGDYLKALRYPLLQGQGCPEFRTDLKAPAKAIVNQRFVEKYAQGLPVVGRHVGFGAQANTEIIGVVADVKEDGLEAQSFPFVYSCLAGGAWPDPEYVVRTAADPRRLLAAVRQVVRNAAPNRAVFGAKPLQEVIDVSLDQPRLSAEVLALFAIAALILAAVGLYSLITLTVTGQTREIGLRVALGAEPWSIVRNVVFEALRPVLYGLAAGSILAAIALRAKVVRAMLFEVHVTDGVTIACVIGVLAAVSLLAATGPVRRAVSIDPLRALREE
jgi:putative ABC transport system permease protein